MHRTLPLTLQTYLTRSFSLLFIAWSFHLFSSLNDTEAELEFTTEPLFVSLGSTCEPSSMLRLTENRKVAFPFDWVVSLDCETLIELLLNGFEDFFSIENLKPYGPSGHLLNTRYHLEFLHDGDFNKEFEKYFTIFKDKYSRRINRFKDLIFYKGKVYFLRSAYRFSMTDPHRFYKNESNLEISNDHAVRLYQALVEIFPDLDFELIILNLSEENSFQEEVWIDDRIRMFRVNPFLDLSTKTRLYEEFFSKLLAEHSHDRGI